KESPAPRQAPPASVGQIEGLFENIFDEQSIEGETAQQESREERIEHSRLDFQKHFALEPDRETAKDKHEQRGDDGHRREPLLRGVAHGKRSEHGSDKHTGRDKKIAEKFVCAEEKGERAEIEGEPTKVTPMALRRSPAHWAPVSARANWSALKACKSSS